MTDPQPDEHVEFTYRGPRPGSIAGAALILIGFGVLAIIITLYALSELDGSGDGIYYGIWSAQLAFSAAQVVSGVFVWRGDPWGRTLALGICSVSLFLAVIVLFTGSAIAALVAFLINGAALALLSRPDAKEWFQP
jgi:hypothetical protein